MAIGKCVNITKPCSKAINREQIEADKANFVCPECGKPLVEIPQEGIKKGKKDEDDAKKINWKFIGIIVAAVLALAGAGFGAWSVWGKTAISQIQLDKHQTSLVLGKDSTMQLAVTALDNKGAKLKDADVVYEWTSSNESIVSVTETGELAALSEGTATVHVRLTETNLTDSCQVEVTKPQPEEPTEPEPVLIDSLALSEQGTITLKPGETKTLKYTASPAENNEKPVWRSSDSTIVSIDDNGELKALKEGTVTISINAQQAAASVEVAVKKASIPPVNPPYGTYSGPRDASGRPHGVGGEVRITRSYSLDLKKSPAEHVQLNSGDKIVNTKYLNGQLKQGEIVFSDGRRKWINL